MVIRGPQRMNPNSLTFTLVPPASGYFSLLAKHFHNCLHQLPLKLPQPFMVFKGNRDPRFFFSCSAMWSLLKWLKKDTVHNITNVFLTTVEMLVEDSWWRAVAKQQTGRELAAHQFLVLPNWMPVLLLTAVYWCPSYCRLGVILVLIPHISHTF